MKISKSYGLLTALVLAISACNRTLPNIQATKNDIPEYNSLDKEYGKFKIRALAQSYLLRKLRNFLGIDASGTVNGTALLKELLYAMQKGESVVPLGAALSEDPTLFEKIMLNSAVAARYSFDAPFAAFLDSFAPSASGSIFVVNTILPLHQFHPAVATDQAGDFVITWQGYDSWGHGIYARRYNSAGVPQDDPEMQVNLTDLGHQWEPDVAMAPNGNFVITWMDDDDVFAQRFDKDGNRLPINGVNEFRINNITDNYQRSPSIAMDGSGNFTITWESFAPEPTYYDVYARRFGSDGNAIDNSEFLVNTTVTAGSQRFPSIAMEDNGDFTIAWYHEGNGIHGRHYSSDLQQVTDFKASDDTATGWNDVAMDSSGDFAVAWENQSYDYNTGGYANGISYRRYNADGSSKDTQESVLLSSSITGKKFPSVGMDDAGDFIIAWTSYDGGNTYGAYYTRYNSEGVQSGPEIRVSDRDGLEPAIVMKPDGEFILSWQGTTSSDNGYYDILAARFKSNGSLK
jgi:hypothetical protein